MDIFIRMRKCTQTVIIMVKFSENIFGVDFIQKHRLHFNQNTQQLSFLQTLSKAIFAVKSFTMQPFAASTAQARSFQTLQGPNLFVLQNLH
jgi:hypothetical protein